VSPLELPEPLSLPRVPSSFPESERRYPDGRATHLLLALLRTLFLAEYLQTQPDTWLRVSGIDSENRVMPVFGARVGDRTDFVAHQAAGSGRY